MEPDIETDLPSSSSLRERELQKLRENAVTKKQVQRFEDFSTGGGNGNTATTTANNHGKTNPHVKKKDSRQSKKGYDDYRDDHHHQDNPTSLHKSRRQWERDLRDHRCIQDDVNDLRDLDEDLSVEETEGGSTHSRSGPFVYTHHTRRGNDPQQSPTSSSVSSLSITECASSVGSPVKSPKQSVPRILTPYNGTEEGRPTLPNTSVSAALLGVVFEGRDEEEIVFEAVSDTGSNSGCEDSFSDEPLFLHDAALMAADIEEAGFFSFDTKRLTNKSVVSLSNEEKELENTQHTNVKTSKPTQTEQEISDFYSGTGFRMSPFWQNKFAYRFWRQTSKKYTSMDDSGIFDDRNEPKSDHPHTHHGKKFEHKIVCSSNSTVTRRLCFVVLLVMIMGIGVAGVILLKHGRAGATYEQPSMTASSDISRREVFRTLLGPLSGFEVFDDTSTPQYKALVWLADEDQAQYDPWNTKLETLIERYIASLLFFSTDGHYWSHRFRFLSSSPICQWNGVFQENLVRNLRRGIICDNSGRPIKIELAENNVTGRLPWELASMELLQTIRLPRNDLSGSLPSQFGLLADLSTIDLTSNSIEGALPNLFGRLDHLQNLKLGSNKIKGTIPTSFGRMGNLTHMDLSHNALTGSLPSELGSLSKLLYLDLSRNNLDGYVPTAELSDLKLDRMNITATNLKGNLNDHFCGNIKHDTEIWADCDGATSGIQCDCCICCSHQSMCSNQLA